MAEIEEAPFSFETDHKDLIHDVQMDYYGKLLATASSDHLVKIFEVSGNNKRLLKNLEGHKGPVWRISWANPRFGRVLGSCGYDKQIIIWRQNKQTHRWEQWFNDNSYDSSVNCISFLPNDILSNTLTLITGDADGYITLYDFIINKNKWQKTSRFHAHQGGVTSISWSLPISIINPINKEIFDEQKNNNNNNNNKSFSKSIINRFVSGGCDNNVKIYEYNINKNEYINTEILTGHNDWIRDVSWAPIPGSNTFNIVASCSEDKTVRIWKQKNNKWQKPQILDKFNNKVWSLAWSELGNILAVANGQNNVKMYKESLDGTWKDVASINE